MPIARVCNVLILRFCVITKSYGKKDKQYNKGMNVAPEINCISKNNGMAAVADPSGQRNSDGS
jgi:hypothetical protein